MPNIEEPERPQGQFRLSRNQLKNGLGANRRCSRSESAFDCDMKRLACCVPAMALVLFWLAGCASESNEVRESGRQPYQSVEDETPQTPGDRRPGPMDDRAGAQWSW